MQLNSIFAWILLGFIFPSIWCGPSRALASYAEDNDLPWGWEEHRDGLNCLQNVIKNFAIPSLASSKLSDVKEDWQMTESGITSNLDITNVLLQYFHWPEKERIQIAHCNLNMEKALNRCKSVYGVDENGKNTCEIIIDDGSIQDKHQLLISGDSKSRPKFKNFVPFVTRKCPDGYKRYGCCKCVRSCKSAGIGLRDENDREYETDERDNALYCPKPRSYRSDHFTRFDLCKGQCEVYGDQFYVQKCSNGFQRVGADLCMAECPHGWPDLGDQCLKVGHLELIPFPWAIGDGQIQGKGDSNKRNDKTGHLL